MGRYKRGYKSSNRGDRYSYSTSNPYLSPTMNLQVEGTFQVSERSHLPHSCGGQAGRCPLTEGANFTDLIWGAK